MLKRERKKKKKKKNSAKGERDINQKSTYFAKARELSIHSHSIPPAVQQPIANSQQPTANSRRVSVCCSPQI